MPRRATQSITLVLLTAAFVPGYEQMVADGQTLPSMRSLADRPPATTQSTATGASNSQNSVYTSPSTGGCSCRHGYSGSSSNSTWIHSGPSGFHGGSSDSGGSSSESSHSTARGGFGATGHSASSGGG